MLSGEDLGIKIRQLLLATKIIIIILTTFNNNYRLYCVIKNVNPDGFSIKNDITPKELVTAIQTVINGSPYFSKTVISLLRK